MRRALTLCLALLLLGILAACGTPPAQEDGGLTVIATVFPAYDWTRNILGELAQDTDLSMLSDTGVDMHSFQPSAADLIRISACDLFIYVGGPSDAWVEDALAGKSNPDRIVLNLMDILGDAVKTEAHLEGMTVEEDVEEDEPDEHVWLSLENARLFCAAIADALAALDPVHGDMYAGNAAAYDGALADLDARFRAAVDAAPLDTLLFGDRFPFRYLADDYDLTCYAAFPGCSAETEASFETVAFLAGKLDELGLPAVLVIDGSDGRIARTIVDSSRSRGAELLTLDSMQAVSGEDIAAGAGYLEIMERNLAVLTAALNG